MFKNSQKSSISKHFLISLLFVVLLFTSVGMNIADTYAADLNQTTSEVVSDFNIEDKLGNSQENIVSLNLEQGDLLGEEPKTHYLSNGGTFADIREKVKIANSGDTIKLTGNFTAETRFDWISINKTLYFDSSTSATLNGLGKTNIFIIHEGAEGSTFKNLNLINAYRDSNGAAMNIMAKNVTVRNCNFMDNVAYQGAAIYSAYNAVDAANLNIERCKFINNHASRSAGAVGAYGDKTKIKNCVFDSNSVYSNSDEMLFGGALQIGLDGVVSRGYVYDCKFTNNYVTSNHNKTHGGAGCVRDGVEYKNCIFINNSAAQGGALTYHASGLIKNCTFSDNSAWLYGGALSTGLKDTMMNLDVENCSFNGNTAPIGGAIQLNGLNIDIKDCKFDNNNASKTGGAININAESVNVVNSEFNSNIANVDGGAIYINGKKTTIKDSSFMSNEAIPDVNKLDDGLGGAIYINSTQATVENNKFYFNTARNGSAIYYDKYGTRLKLVNNTLYQNQAWVYALPIYAKNIYYTESEKIGAIIHGGNNIAKYGNLAVSNAIYNAANNAFIEIDGETPVLGATTNGHLYQDDREYNMEILLTVTHEDGTVVYNKTLNSDVFGEVTDNLDNLKVGKYYVTAKHKEDTYYKAITNKTSFLVIPQVDDSVRKSVNPDEDINYQDIVIWTLNITNNGPNNATNVIIKDVLPEGLIYLEDDSEYEYNNKTGTFKIDFLEVGQIVIINIKTIVDKTGEIVNKVNVTADQHDYNLTNNHDQSKIDVKPATDLAIVKSANVSVCNLGDYVTWTLTVTNNGPDTATGVVVSDLLPKSLIFINSIAGNYNETSGRWDIGTLTKGASVSLKIVCRVNATGLIENEASVKGNEHDLDETNNHASKTIRVNDACDLTISKISSPSVVNYTDVFKWTLTVTNNGPNDATGVKIYDALPGGFVVLNSTVPLVNGVMDIGDIVVNGKVTVDVYCRANITGTFVNVASVKGEQFDPNMNNNKDDATIVVKPAADLAILKSVNDTTPNFGDLITWTLTVTNNGPDIATGVVVTDLLPKGLIYVNSTSKKYDGVSGKWNIGNLTKGTSINLKIICRVNATGLIENKAYVSGNEFDPIKSNNNASKIIDVDLASDLGIVKLVSPGVVNYTDVVKWTLIVSNYGPDAATGVEIYDALPGGFVVLNSTVPLVNGVMNIGDLAVNGKVTVDIYCRANITGTFVNVASVKGQQYDYNIKNNKANATVVVKPATDLVVKKSANVSTLNLGDLVTWTITVTNNGPDSATGVIVKDLLPKSLKFITSGGNYNNNTGIWNVGSLTKGTSESLNIVCKVVETGLIENSVSVSGNEFDPDMSNNNDSVVITVKPACDLGIVKLVSPGVVNYTDVVKWTLIVSNYGPDAATGVEIYDALPGGFVVLNSSVPLVNGVMDIGDLAVNGKVTVDIYCRANITGTFVNVASVKGNEFDPNGKNNKANATVVVKPATDLVVKKSANVSTLNLGDLVTWTITVTNNGPDTATGVIVNDLLPKSLIFVNASNSNYNNITGQWNVGSLTKGASASLNIITKVNVTGIIKNSVSVSGNEFDHDVSNNNDSVVITVKPACDLGIVKLVSPGVVNYTDVVKWTLIVSNYGPDAATGVKINDALPAGFVVLNSTVPLVNGVMDIGDLAVNGKMIIDIYCRVNITGTFVNVASVKGNEFDPNGKNNKANATVVVKPATDLLVIKEVNNTKPNFGDLVTWTLTVINRGPDTATGVIVSDLLPESLIWKNDNGLGKYNHETGIWDIGEITNGQSKTLEIIAKVNATGFFVNNVSVTGNEFDYNKSNNNDNETINVSKAADLYVIKLSNASFVNYHELVKWTIIAYNNGPDKATGVFVEDMLPEGLILQNYTASKGFYDNGIWSVCCIEKGENQTLELICWVNKTGKLTNVVKINGSEYDPNISNNENNKSVLVPKSSDLSVVKTVDNPYPNFAQVIEWKIVITNNGPDNSTDISVIDNLPDGLQLLSYRATAGNYGDSIWYLNQLNVGCSETLILRCLVDTLDDVENIAEVIPSQYDWNMSNNKDSDFVTVNPIADLGIIKYVNVSQANYMDLVKWTLIVSNYGPNDATGVEVSDVIPKGLSIVKMDGDGELENSIWYVGDLRNGQSKALNIVCKVLATGSFTNVASVCGVETDPDLTNNEGEDSLYVPPASDISVTKTVSKYKFSTGDLVKYSVKLTNNGPDRAKNVKVKEIMDDSLLLQSCDVTKGDFNKLNDVWSVDMLDVGETALLKIKAIASKPGSARNDVSATSDNYDPDLSNNNDTVSINITKKEDIPKKENFKKHTANERELYQSILEKYQSGNPLVVVLISLVFSMGVFCTNNIFKRR